jgi:uncharacterized protein YndB with AHSA1/START domain
MFDSVRLQAVYPYRPEQVWVALTDRRALAEWLMPNDFEPVVGHKFRFQIDPTPACHSITLCEVLEVDRPRRLVYSWMPATDEHSKPQGQPSIVTWTLSPEPGGTRLVLEHTGLVGPFPWWQRMMLRFGWGTMVKSWIRKVAARVQPDGTFRPGAIPLQKRCYKAAQVPEFLTK